MELQRIIEQTKTDINLQLAVIEDAILWAEKYKDSFPKEDFKKYRREIKQIKEALSDQCSAAAYGESQVGKSYLMDSLLGSASRKFEIENQGHRYSFINDINSSGGNNNKIETTGVITRFTLNGRCERMKDYVRIRVLTVVDIILLLADSYYNDVNINVENSLGQEEINSLLQDMMARWQGRKALQHIIEEDDVRLIQKYLSRRAGQQAKSLIDSRFFDMLASHIALLESDEWTGVFGLIWNNNPHLNQLFQTLVSEYGKLGFSAYVYVPFDSVLRKNGTLLNVDWLNAACGMQVDTTEMQVKTDVYAEDGSLLASDFLKSYLSALTAEITFFLPEEIAAERPFLRHLDLLDFPGARAREELDEAQLEEPEVMARVMRRGKVAYLFNKYSSSKRINSLLYCHHNDQKSESKTTKTISCWIDDVIGNTPQKRAESIRLTNGCSPLMFVATKFNLDIARSEVKDTPDLGAEGLREHWSRFDTVIPEIIKPATWMDEWVESDRTGRVEPFSGIYPLRDYYWSGKELIFDGYLTEGTESRLHQYADYPEYFTDLRDSFLENAFVKKHIKDPQATWNQVMSPNSDGSVAIIRELNSIAPLLNQARLTLYRQRLEEIKRILLNSLSTFYQSDSDESKNVRLKNIVSDVKISMEMSLGSKPEVFGKMLDLLMVQSNAIREVAADIIIRKMDVPRDFNQISLIRAFAGINTADSREVNIRKMCEKYSCAGEEELSRKFEPYGVDVEQVVSGDTEVMSTMADVLTKHILEYWTQHINSAIAELSQYISHPDDVVNGLQILIRELKVKQDITRKIDDYLKVFSNTSDQPNAIGDLVSLILNGFVSNVGRNYMSAQQIELVNKKAGFCGISVDVSSDGFQKEHVEQSLERTLAVLEESERLMHAGCFDDNTVNTLRQLPLYDNFKRWENLLMIGLVLSNDVVTCDPVANAAIRKIIDNCDKLYK